MDARDPHNLPAACQAVADDLLDRVDGSAAPALPTALASHLDGCAACQERLSRMQAQAQALRQLERLPVPAELDGRVVAATQAGYRQDRATTMLTSLERRVAPEELDQLASEDPAWAAAGATERRPVPSVLDRLVDESLHDLPGSVSRKLLDRLPRQKAPAELDARVESLLAASPGTQAAPAPLARRRLRGLLAVPAGMAAAAVLFALLSPMMGSSSDPEPQYGFRVVRQGDFSPENHSERTLLMLETFTGQMLRREL